MTAFRHEQWLDQAIRSVLEQDIAEHVEVLVGVDPSEDETAEIATSWAARVPDRIRALVRAERLGLLRNFIETYRQARGEYVALLEGDDYWVHDQKLRKQVHLHDTVELVSLSGHNVEQVTVEGEVLEPMPQQPYDRISEAELFVSRGCDFHTSSLMFPRILGEGELEALLDERARVFDLTLKLILSGRGRIGYLPETMSVFRRSKGSASADLHTNPRGWRPAILQGLENARPFIGGEARVALNRWIGEVAWDGVRSEAEPLPDRLRFAARALRRAPWHVAVRAVRRGYSGRPEWQKKIFRALRRRILGEGL